MSSDISSIYSQDNINSSNLNGDGIYEFENFRLDAVHLMLYKEKKPITLAPKVIETLLALVERSGEVVSKDEMMDRLWHDSFVEESNLTQNIYLLRKTLGKGADGRDLIETFRRRGYRFTGKIKNLTSEKTETVASEKILDLETGETEKTVKAASNFFDSLAVLPLKNESNDETVEYLCDGITESIINRLSQLKNLRVVASHTVFRYKGKDLSPQEIGRDLGVSAVLSGRVLQFGEKLIVRTELVDADNGWQIWGEQFNRPATDILDLQETIAREISENLRLKMSGEEQARLTKRYTESAEAYHLYIKGRFQLNKRLTESIRQAAEYFQKAIDIDAEYAPAYVGLADCFPLLSLYGSLTPREAYPQAKAAAEKALEIDPRMSKAYNSLGVVKLFYEWDWRGAENAFRQAIELNPHYADAHQRYGMLLTAEGRFDEAVIQLKRARESDPLSLIIKTISGYPFYYSRQFEKAKEHFREVIELDANYSMAHFRLGLTYAQENKFDEAIAELGRSTVLSGDRDVVAALGYVHGLKGDTEKAQDALDELAEREESGFVSAYNKAIVYAGSGNTDAALDWLEKAFEERSYWLIYLKVDPILDSLRASPRFIKLQENIFGADAAAERDSEKAISLDDFHLQPNPKAIAEKEFSPIADKRKRYFMILTAITAVVLLTVFAVAYFFKSKPSKSQNQSAASNLKITRLTPDLNVHISEFTPDGKSLIYTLFEKGKTSVWIKDLATGGATMILPPTDTGYNYPQISLDGKMIYYVTNRPEKANGTLVRVPLAGGTIEEVVSNIVSPVAFSPDEKQISFINGDDGQLRIANIDGSGERILAKREPGKGWFESWNSGMSWSPDGSLIAICGGRYVDGGKKVYQLILINTADGSEQTVPIPAWNYLDDVRWLNDGSGFLVVARETEASPWQIWQVSYSDGATRRITGDTNDYVDIALSPDSRLLVANQYFQNLNIWTAPFDEMPKAKQITFGNRASDGIYGIGYTPDGKIIYTSLRTGNLDLWQMNADGGEQMQLTKNNGEVNARPQVTPDGRFIIFVSTRTGTRQIWRMDADGRNPKQLTDVFNADSPGLSPDGKWIYFTLNDGEKAYIAKISIDGGAAVHISKTPHNVGFRSISPDGKLIFHQIYEKGSAQPWRMALMSAETGLQIKVFADNSEGLWGADSNSIIYVKEPARTNIFRMPLNESEEQQLTNFESGYIRVFAISPDRKQIAISRGNPSSEAVLLENF